jgi:outer membrane protein assembly factor BamA
MTGKKVFPKIIVDDVQIDGATQIPVSVIQDVTAKARGREFDGGEDWLNVIQDSQVRDAWQDRGFFKVLATAEPTLLFGDATTQHYAVIIHVEEGEQFHLGKVEFWSSDPAVPLAFPVPQLREMLPMNEGDVFAASKVREGLDNMHGAYINHSYVDFVATPLTDIDDSKQTISLTFEFDQQEQYRIGKIMMRGLTLRQENRIYNNSKFERFFEINKSMLPEGTSLQNAEITRHVQEGILDFQLYFHPCPSTNN